MLEHIEIILIKGGIVMIPLGVCSFLVVLITLEKILVLRKNRLASKYYFESWRTWFKVGEMDTDLPDLNTPSIVSKVLHPMTGFFPLPLPRFEERLADLCKSQKHKMERGLVILDTIAGIAPLFGLLGTALGMVEVFSRLSVSGEAKMSALSSGISQALFTTVAGLCIGIPALIAYNLLTRHIDSILIVVEEQLNSLTDEFYSLIVKNDELPGTK